MGVRSEKGNAERRHLTTAASPAAGPERPSEGRKAQRFPILEPPCFGEVCAFGSVQHLTTKPVSAVVVLAVRPLFNRCMRQTYESDFRATEPSGSLRQQAQDSRMIQS